MYLPICKLHSFRKSNLSYVPVYALALFNFTFCDVMHIRVFLFFKTDQSHESAFLTSNGSGSLKKKLRRYKHRKFPYTYFAHAQQRRRRIFWEKQEPLLPRGGGGKHKRSTQFPKKDFPFGSLLCPAFSSTHSIFPLPHARKKKDSEKFVSRVALCWEGCFMGKM